MQGTSNAALRTTIAHLTPMSHECLEAVLSVQVPQLHESVLGAAEVRKKTKTKMNSGFCIASFPVSPPLMHEVKERGFGRQKVDGFVGTRAG